MATDVDPEELARELRPYVRALFRVMILELNALRVDRGSLGPLTEAERHRLDHGHALAEGCCRRDRSRLPSIP